MTDQNLIDDFLNKLSQNEIKVILTIGALSLTTITHPTLKTSQLAFVLSKNIELPINEKILTGQVQIGGHLFKFSSQFTKVLDYIVCPAPTDITVVQRRQNYRSEIPKTLPHKLVLPDFSRYECRILDLSLGGVLIQVKEPLFPKRKPEESNLKYDFRPNMELKIEITLLEFAKENLWTQVRVVRPTEDQSGLKLGLEFAKLSSKQSETIQNILLKLERLNNS